MIRVKLPIINKTIVNGKIVVDEEEKEFSLDTSLAAQIRYEKKFPELAAQCDLFDYIERITAYKQKGLSLAISQLKTIYCLIDFDYDFIQFVQLFDFSSPEYTNKLINKIKEIFQIVLNSSSEKN